VSIRVRVTLVTVAIAALGIVATDATTFFLLRSYVDNRAHSSVRQAASSAAAALSRGEKLELPVVAGGDRAVLVELLLPNGQVGARAETAEGASVRLPADLGSRLGRPFELGSPPRFQAIAVSSPRGTLVAVVSVMSEVSTLSDLLRLNLIVGAIVLVLLALVAAIVLTRSLRPLRRIAMTADAIVAGDLGARVPDAPRRSEIGRVAKALNRMLAENQAAFAARDSTESRLRQFLADASHELRTPLTSIRGYAELFRRGADRRPDDLARVMRAIEDEATRMSRLVEDLLLLAQLDDARPLVFERIALDDLLEAAIDAARAVEPERPIQFELAQRPLIAEIDEGRIRQVLDNLIANIRQHTPPGAPAFLSLRASDGEAVLTVEDTGPGVPERDRDVVFDRFSRPDESRDRDLGGAGLGLAIVRSIVTAHGGTIELRAAQPHGSVFEIRLPLSRETSSRGTLS
jgi:two-component system OmpR family sensor kinase